MDSMERPGRPSRPLALTMLRAAKEGAGGSGMVSVAVGVWQWQIQRVQR